MFKHPALRVSDIEDVDKDTLQQLSHDLKTWLFLTPFAPIVTDLEIVGSYARGKAELHSDIDVNIATASEEDRIKAHTLISENKEQFRQACSFMRGLWRKWGIRIEVQFQDLSVKNLHYKRCFSLFEKKSYGTERRRMDKDFRSGEVRERIRLKLREPKFDVPSIEDDPWFAELPKWRKAYGRKFQEFGDTPETAHLKHR